MRFLYLSRRNNRSGFFILDYLLRNTSFIPEAVVLPSYTGRKIHRQFEYGFAGEKSELELPTLESPFSMSIEDLCQEFGLPIIYLTDINGQDGLRRIRALSPDLLALGGGWPQLLSDDVYTCAPLGVINTHPSLLPRFRGTDVHRWQIFEGVKVSGATIHYIDSKFDTGTILAQCAIAIQLGDTPQKLATRAGLAAGPLMAGVLNKIRDASPNLITGQVQEAITAKESYFSRWPWENRNFLAIRWEEPNDKILRLVLASTQENLRYSGAHFRVNGMDVIVRQADIVDQEAPQSAKPGEILSLDRSGLVVACGLGTLRLEVLQEMTSFWPEGFNTLPPSFGYQFCLEHKISVGITLQEGSHP